MTITCGPVHSERSDYSDRFVSSDIQPPMHPAHRYTENCKSSNRRLSPSELDGINPVITKRIILYIHKTCTITENI